MTSGNTNLRKAAVLVRSLDGDTAALMLGQLSVEEAAAVRAAMREMGPVDFAEQADIAAELRGSRPAPEPAAGSVELLLSNPVQGGGHRALNEPTDPAPANGRRFEFVANASTSALVTFLCREHPQTIAVVLAHVAPDRAATVLAALPERLQADTIERLAALGEADPESVVLLERELASWLAVRGECRGALARRRETVANILAATDAKTRRGILSKLRIHNTQLASQLAGDALRPAPRRDDQRAFDGNQRLSGIRRLESAQPRPLESNFHSQQASDTNAKIHRGLAAVRHMAAAVEPPPPPPVPRIEFDQLIHLDSAGISALLREVDANVLAMALVGSREEFVDRICGQMPKRTARAFRRELRRIGPTRLSDVETAQQVVAATAVRQLAERRRSFASAC